MKKLLTPIQPLCCTVPDLTPQTKDITMGQIKKENPPQMSCCYGIMVFLGLFASLLTLTLLVIYAGVWTQRSLYGKTNLNNQQWIKQGIEIHQLKVCGLCRYAVLIESKTIEIRGFWPKALQILMYTDFMRIFCGSISVRHQVNWKI